MNKRTPSPSAAALAVLAGRRHRPGRAPRNGPAAATLGVRPPSPTPRRSSTSAPARQPPRPSTRSATTSPASSAARLDHPPPALRTHHPGRPRLAFANLRARFGGDDSWQRPVDLLLGCHIDSKNIAGIEFLGADDAASAAGAHPRHRRRTRPRSRHRPPGRNRLLRRRGGLRPRHDHHRRPLRQPPLRPRVCETGTRRRVTASSST